MDTTYADSVAHEQRYLDEVQETFAALLHKLSLRRSGADDFAEEAMDLMRRERLRSYTEASGPLYFGRVDFGADTTLYIGRHAVVDRDNRLLSINWRAPAAEPFYAATATDPLGATRRRRLDIEDGRVLGYVDEHFSVQETDGLTDAIIRDITQQRVGEMRQIISTITPEQYDLIRDEAPGALVIQGGPGTGKTAVGLHRAAWLLYRHANLAREGVLVVGPNLTFIRYISQVLPALGEGGVQQRPIDALVSQRHGPLPYDSAGAPLKGDGRMATVLAALAWNRLRDLEAEVVIELGRREVTVSPEDVRELMSIARSQTRSYEAGRERFRERLASWIAARAHEVTDESVLAEQSVIISAVRKTKGYQRVCNRCWPRLTASQLYGDLFRGRARLRVAADGVLEAAEVDQLEGMAVPRNTAEMTAADVALMDEAGWLVQPEIRTFGHVVIDEAQNLSVMELRMIVRRARGQSLTILGDIAQRTVDVGLTTWERVLDDAGVRERRLSELQLSYRVPDDFLRIAAAVVPAGAAVPTGVREAPWPAVSVRTGRAQSALVAVSLATRMASDVGSVALVVPEGALEDFRQALIGHEHVEAAGDTLSQGINLVELDVVKGLEFDAVIVVEPAAMLAQPHTGGPGGLFTALTRSTKALAIVHSGPLPPGLASARDLHQLDDADPATAFARLRRADTTAGPPPTD